MANSTSIAFVSDYLDAASNDSAANFTNASAVDAYFEVVTRGFHFDNMVGTGLWFLSEGVSRVAVVSSERGKTSYDAS